MLAWARFANSHGDMRTREGTTAQRSKGPFSQSPFTYLNINSPFTAARMLLLVHGTLTLLCFSLKFSFMLNEHLIWPWHLQTDFQLTWMLAHEIPCVGWHSGGGHPTILQWGKWSCFLLPVTVLVGNSVLAIQLLLFCDPLAAGEVLSLKKKKRYYSEKVRDTGALAGKPLVGVCTPSVRFDRPYIVSPLCPSVYHLLCSDGRIWFFCKTQSCKTAEIKSMQYDPLASFFTKLSK